MIKEWKIDSSLGVAYFLDINVINPMINEFTLERLIFEFCLIIMSDMKLYWESKALYLNLWSMKMSVEYKDQNFLLDLIW